MIGLSHKKTLRFDLHIHSTFSDGRDGVDAILRAAQECGLDGISITDHDSLEGSLAAQRLIKKEDLDLILIPGLEVSTSDGHLLALGVAKAPPPYRSPEETVNNVHRQGGIAVVAHPYHPFRHAMFRIPDCDAVEVYNSRYILGLANAWAHMEAKRRKLPMVAGSDAHRADTVGLGVTEIEVGNDGDILDAIRAGRTKIVGRRTPPRVLAEQMTLWAKRRIGRKKEG